jgi:hypothetical protein
MPAPNTINRIRRKLPADARLPNEFEILAATKLPLKIAWSSLRAYGLSKTAEKVLIPFLQLADGGLVAFWYVVSPPAVVYIDSHGDPARIIAKDLSNFLRSISHSRTGIADIDEDCADISITGYEAKPSRSGLTALQKKLNAWCESNSALQPPSNTKESERLRKRIHKVASQMVREGLSKVYKSRSEWSMSFEIQRTRSDFAVRYLDYGKWYDVPVHYGIESLVREMYALIKNPTIRKCALDVTKDGLVSVDRDRQLLLTPQA